jgi:hypothetical protein
MTPRIGDRHIQQLWIKLTQMYGHRWTSAYGDHDVEGIWLRVLQDLNPRQLAAGLDALVRNGEAWPPTAPEFRALCESASLRAYGLPEPDQAFNEVVHNAHRPTEAKWSHPAVYIAGRETGWFDIRHAYPGDKWDERFYRAYQILCRRVMAGEEVDAEIAASLEDTRGQNRPLTEQDRQAGSAALQALKEAVRFPAELGKYGCPNCEGETPVDAKDYRLTRDLRELTEYLRESVSEQDALLVEEAIDRIRHLNETNRALQGNQPEASESSSRKPAAYNSDQEAAQ